MLTQQEIDYLLQILKNLNEKQPLIFPPVSYSKEYNIISEDKKEKFIIDVNRKGHIKLTKCTFQKRYYGHILLRLDIDGRPHTNPDEQEIPCPHLHILKEGYGTSWAYHIPDNIFEDTTNLLLSFINFLEYCKVKDTNSIMIQDGLGL